LENVGEATAGGDGTFAGAYKGKNWRDTTITACSSTPPRLCMDVSDLYRHRIAEYQRVECLYTVLGTQVQAKE